SAKSVDKQEASRAFQIAENFRKLHNASAFLAAANAGDDDAHEFDRLAERERWSAAAEEIDEGQQLSPEGVVGVGQFERQLSLGSVKMQRAARDRRIGTGAY